MCWSPNKDLFQPPKLWKAMGTGIGILIPTIPIFALEEKVLPESPSLVKILTPLPNSWSFTNFKASSKSLALTIDKTGPNISYLYIRMSLETWSKRHPPI